MTLIYTNKTKLTLETPEEFVPYLTKYFDTFKRLTSELSNRISDEILINERIKSNIFELLKKTLRLGSGSLKHDKLKSLLGWNDEEIKTHAEYMSSRHVSKLIRLGLDRESAEVEYAKQQKNSSRRSLYYWINLGYDEATALIKLKEYQSSATKKHKEKLTNDEYAEFKKNSSNRCKEHWIKLGYSEEDAINEIAKLQSKVSKRCKEYWISKGYTEEDAIIAVSEYQKSSMDGKTLEEIAVINKKKANAFGFNNYWDENLENVSGAFYIIKLNHNLYKIGITTKSVTIRYHQKDLIDKEILVEHRCDSIQHAFEIEQLLKREFSHTVKRDDYGVFGWTEVLHTEYEQIKDAFDKYINNRDVVKQKFRALKNEDNNVQY